MNAIKQATNINYEYWKPMKSEFKSFILMPRILLIKKPSYSDGFFIIEKNNY